MLLPMVEKLKGCAIEIAREISLGPLNDGGKQATSTVGWNLSVLVQRDRDVPSIEWVENRNCPWLDGILLHRRLLCMRVKREGNGQSWNYWKLRWVRIDAFVDFGVANVLTFSLTSFHGMVTWGWHEAWLKFSLFELPALDASCRYFSNDNADILMTISFNDNRSMMTQMTMVTTWKLQWNERKKGLALFQCLPN